MNAPRAIIGLIVAASLGGCASLEPSERRSIEVRSDYVAAVETAAHQQRVEVIWINPPQRERSRQIEWRQQIPARRSEDPDS